MTASKTGNLDMQDNIPKEKAEPASNETVWAFDPGNVPRPSDGRRWRTRQADGVTDAEFNQAAEQACGNGTWAKFRANYVGVVAGMTRRFFDFSEKYAVLEREANIIADLPRQYGKPEEYRFYKGDPNNDPQSVTKEALIAAIATKVTPTGRKHIGCVHPPGRSGSVPKRVSSRNFWAQHTEK